MANKAEFKQARKRTAVPIADLCVKYIKDNESDILDDIAQSDLAVKAVAYPIADFTPLEWFNNPLVKDVTKDIADRCTEFNIGFLRKPYENSRGKTYSQPWALELSLKA